MRVSSLLLALAAASLPSHSAHGSNWDPKVTAQARATLARMTLAQKLTLVHGANGSYVGKALSKDPVGLAALTSTTQDVTVRFENLALLRQLVAVREQQTAAYKIESVLYVTSGEEELNIKTSNSGSVDLRALTSAAK